MNLGRIHNLIEQTKHWRAQHKAASRAIEAAACDIRIIALEDALKAMEKTDG